MSSYAYAQSTQRIVFVAESPQSPDTSVVFTYNRIHEKNNILKENGLFGNPLTSTHIFRQVNQDWYYKSGTAWKPFYLHAQPVHPVIRSDGVSCKLRNMGRDSLAGIPCTLYETSGSGVVVSDHIIFWFSSRFGVIRIVANSLALVRKDILNGSNIE
ncbi:hypothetical protein CTE07_09440 [Chitinophaga terrae (ex Kim and Jung 2007)]|nr:hypothetical protein CTE07_09440 [Chitinophaga terrae (ex Kim and Jung 2007)]